MAFAQLGLATGEDEYTHIAKATYDRILERQTNPKGRYNKAVPGTRNLKNFTLPMIMCNLNLEMEHILGKEFVEQSAETQIDQPGLASLLKQHLFLGVLNSSFHPPILSQRMYKIVHKP